MGYALLIFFTLSYAKMNHSVDYVYWYNSFDMRSEISMPLKARYLLEKPEYGFQYFDENNKKIFLNFPLAIINSTVLSITADNYEYFFIKSYKNHNFFSIEQRLKEKQGYFQWANKDIKIKIYNGNESLDSNNIDFFSVRMLDSQGSIYVGFLHKNLSEYFVYFDNQDSPPLVMKILDVNENQISIVFLNDNPRIPLMLAMEEYDYDW